LAYIGRKRDNFCVVGFFKPFNDNGGVEASGVGEHNFHIKKEVLEIVWFAQSKNAA